MINNTNFKQVLFEFAQEKYGKRFEEFYDLFFEEFPYDYDDLDDELYFKNFIDWLMIEKALPETGKTIVDEFVEMHPALDEEMRRNLLGMKDVIRSEFIVLSKSKLELTVKDRNTKKVYLVRLYSAAPVVGRNSIILGRIHPFGAFYRFAGVFFVHNSPMILDPDVLMTALDERNIDEIESMILSPHTKLTAILNKYPFQWVVSLQSSESMLKKEKTTK